LQQTAAKRLSHLGLDVNTDHPSLRANPASDLAGEIADAWSHLQNRVAPTYAKAVNRPPKRVHHPPGQVIEHPAPTV